MTEDKQEGQKTVVSFIVGLLIGGLLVWAFSTPTNEKAEMKSDDTKSEEVEEKEDKNTEQKSDEEMVEEVKEVVKAVLPVGDGKIEVKNQAASANVELVGATYPVKEGWIGVRDYQEGQLGGLLGVVRFSEEQGLVPTSILLQRSTKAGSEYAVVVYEENGDRQFNLAEDVQIDTIFSSFTAE